MIPKGKKGNRGYILPLGRWGEAQSDVAEGLEWRETGERLWKICEELLKVVFIRLRVIKIRSYF